MKLNKYSKAIIKLKLILSATVLTSIKWIKKMLFLWEEHIKLLVEKLFYNSQCPSVGDARIVQFLALPLQDL